MKYLFRTRRAPADMANRLMRATIIYVCALCPVASAQTLRPIYGVAELGTVTSWPEPIRPSQTNTAVMKHEILVSARQYWRDQNRDCSEDFRIVGATTGSFTRPGSVQTAILYSYCLTGHNWAQNGIAVLENGVPAAHVVYEGGWDSGIIPVQDIDGTRQTQILIVTGGTNLGETWQIISVVELSDAGVKKFGLTNTYDDDCANAGESRKTAYKLFAKAGATPRFYHQRYETDCSAKERWLKSGTMQQVALEKDGTVYVRLK